MPFGNLHYHPTATVQDSVIASSLIAAPAWGAWLNELNGVLTTLSLLVGLLIGLHRLWVVFSATKPKSKD